MRCSCGMESPDTATRCAGCGQPLRREMDWRRWLLDAVAGLGLLLALVLVFALDRGSQTSEGGNLDRHSDAGQTADEDAGSGRPLRLAVTPRHYDDMGKLLDQMGAGYRWEPIRYDDLLRPEVLAEYDVVFFTCGGLPLRWLGQKKSVSERSGNDLCVIRPSYGSRLGERLRTFVERGGTLYASDYRFKAIALAFPELVDRSLAIPGAVQTVRAEVLDPGLQRRLGTEIDLQFDKKAWDPAAFRGPEVTTYLRGRYKTVDGEFRTAPLLIRFPHGDGTVIFTSFHNEAQNSEIETELLRYLVFASVLARAESDARRTLVRGGFSPVEGNLLSASAGDQSIAETYEAKQSGDLQFVLAFEDRGAELQLVVTGPDGRRLEKTGTSTFSIRAAEAPAGSWQYTITPLEVPYRNFPCSLTVGQKE